MTVSRFINPAIRVLLLTAFLIAPGGYYSDPQSAPAIGVNGSTLPSKTPRRRTVQGTIAMDIPSGYHVNSNHPLEKFLIATQLRIEAPKGLRVGPILYPRPVLRSLRFSKNKVSVFEGHTTIRFNVTVPANFAANSGELKARLRYQSCNDDFCFPPQTREVSLWLAIGG